MIFYATEFFYANPSDINDSEIILGSEESNHAINVMRHSPQDLLNITDGLGNVYTAKILKISKFETFLEIESKSFRENKFWNYTFFLPVLKSIDRLELAIEKSVELGITNFVIFNSENSYKRGIKLRRWEKIALAAMKQSLRAHKPILTYHKSLKSVSQEGESFIIFDQLAINRFKDVEDVSNRKLSLIFGPEAGLSKNEQEIISEKMFFSLSEARLRTETAVITAASVLSSNL